ncbi:leucine-rich repeat domain-containing protein [Urechidicola croceus]|uniref:Ig-like domain-containing protein n=1 Tax=Urechidicola croceus TaxID=1850246 RepID=A0A1D8P4L6_9FLAO|nr:T9SS type A sorting domain-containing protein [Urechidicola croceus]AOW19530.1 hypothetical protein LPB138_02035 [Urechidicola croceus]
MKRFLLLFSVFLISQINLWSQCPPGSDSDTDGDGVLDCIDPCNNVASSIIGNQSFESDFIGWTIPQNEEYFTINENTEHILHGNKSLVVTAPNNSTFEEYAIYSEEFTLHEGVTYNFKIPVKRIGDIDGDALRWVLIDENGAYRHFNNHYSFTSDWSFLEFNNFTVNFNNFTSNKFRLRLEFGLSEVDMVVDKIEFYESSLNFDPAYYDADADGNLDCVPLTINNHPDYDALVALYNATEGENWTNNTNWLTNEPISTWHGVYTDENDRVYYIDLTNNNLTGSIPNTINDLSSLQYLLLGYNNLAGNIPSEIGDISSLLYLNLEVNQLNGIIPSEIGNLYNLYYLRLNTNQLTGSIPIEITNLSNLITLNLAVNDLTGSIPSDIGNVTSLTTLKLGDNNFFGTVIPPEIGNLTNLYELDLRACNLTGEIPSEIGNLTNLNYLYLFFNNLSGQVPTELQNLTNLINFQISNNILSGDIPDFTNLTNLAYFNISNNSFQFGDFENEFTTYQNNIPEFTYAPQSNRSQVIYNVDFNVDANAFIPNNTDVIINANTIGTNNLYQWYKNGIAIEDATFETLSLLNFDFTFSGEYYCEITNSVVTGLTLYTNPATITTPISEHPDYNALETLYNATNGDNWSNNTNWLSNSPLNTWYGITLNNNNRVSSINLFNNNLIGELPVITNGLDNINVLSLYSNNLSGTIPSEIENLNQLSTLDLSGNQFSGEIPSSLGNLSNLNTLSLSINQLTGEIPIEIGSLTDLSYLGIYSNQLEGNIPASIGNLSNLEYLILGFNQLSGELDTNLSNLNNLIYLYLSSNNLNGSIPQEIAEIPSLTYFYIDNNNLSGQLPDFSLSAITTENSVLNISYNNFIFADLENQFEYLINNVPNFFYNPMNPFGDVQEPITTGIGENITLTTIFDTGTRQTARGAENEYQWYKDDVAIDGANEATYTIENTTEEDTGIYVAKVTNTDIPDLTLESIPYDITIDAALGIDELKDTKFSVYPNPANDILFVSNISDLAKIEIYDLLGKKVISKENITSQTQLKLTNLKTGVYILKVSINNKVLTQKLIKN